MPTPPALGLFYSYSHQDEGLRDRLKTHLAMLRREGVISEWHDRRILAGQEWDKKIDEHLNSADIILLLVSPDFLASDYCYDIEVNRAMQRHEDGEARVIPVILRPSDWASAPFSRLQSLPTGARPVTRWDDPDEPFLDIARGIRAAAAELNERRRPAEPTPPAESAKPSPRPQIPDLLRVAFVSRRDREGNDIVARLTDELAPGRNRLVVLWGAGGVGKTAIAAEAARGLSEPFNQRVVWASAEAREDFNLSLLLDSIATQLGYPDLRKLALEPKKEQIREVLMESPALVVLDNFETIVPAEADLCAAWLAQSAPCSALVTTRQMIEPARNIPLEQMFSDEAHNLLQRLMSEVHNPSAFAGLDRERVISTAESNPLVLQWIVGQIDLAQDPDEVLNDLALGEGPAAKRVFDRSFNLPQLNAGGRPVLLALSLFVPSATRTALSEVAGMSRDKDKKRFKEAVKTLSALWLIRATEEQRLAVGGLTRELTKARLSTDPRSKIFRQRFVARFSNFAATHQKPTPANFNALEAEKDNLQAAVDVACELQSWETATGLSSLLVSGMLSVRGYWDEAVKLLEQALQIAPLTRDENQVADISHNLAVMYQNRGELREARRLYQESLEIFRRLGDQHSIAASLHQLGNLAKDAGEMGEARRLCQESLEIDRRLGHQSGIAASLHQLGILAQHTGEMGEARRLYQESLETKQRLGDQSGIANSLGALGTIAQKQGDFGEAQRFYTESLEIGRKLKNQSGIAFSLHGLGSLRLAEKDFETAERFLSESLETLKKLGDKRNVAECLESMGQLRAEQERLPEALALYSEALGIAEALNAKGRIGSVKHSLGTLALKRGEGEEAARLFREALDIFEELGSAKREVARRSLEGLGGGPS